MVCWQASRTGRIHRRLAYIRHGLELWSFCTHPRQLETYAECRTPSFLHHYDPPEIHKTGLSARKFLCPRPQRAGPHTFHWLLVLLNVSSSCTSNVWLKKSRAFTVFLNSYTEVHPIRNSIGSMSRRRGAKRALAVLDSWASPQLLLAALNV